MTESINTKNLSSSDSAQFNTLGAGGIVSLTNPTGATYNNDFPTATGALKVIGGILQHNGTATNYFGGSTTINGKLNVSGVTIISDDLTVKKISILN